MPDHSSQAIVDPAAPGSTARIAKGRKPDTVTLELTVEEAWFLRVHWALSGEIADDAAAFNDGEARAFSLDALLAKIDATASAAVRRAA